MEKNYEKSIERCIDTYLSRDLKKICSKDNTPQTNSKIILNCYDRKIPRKIWLLWNVKVSEKLPPAIKTWEAVEDMLKSIATETPEINENTIINTTAEICYKYDINPESDCICTELCTASLDDTYKCLNNIKDKKHSNITVSDKDWRTFIHLYYHKYSLKQKK